MPARAEFAMAFVSGSYFGDDLAKHLECWMAAHELEDGKPKDWAVHKATATSYNSESPHSILPAPFYMMTAHQIMRVGTSHVSDRKV